MGKTYNKPKQDDEFSSGRSGKHSKHANGKKAEFILMSGMEYFLCLLWSPNFDFCGFYGIAIQLMGDSLFVFGDVSTFGVIKELNEKADLIIASTS